MRPTDTTAAVRVRRARTAVAVAFVVNGFAFASWISRVPATRDTLSLSAAGLGLLLLCVAAGSTVALPATGPVVHRIGPARGVLAGAAVATTGLVLLGAALGWASVPLAGAGLALIGVGVGGWDVAMNIEGAAVEQRLGRPLMPRLHAGFSLGTVAGALIGAAAAALAFPLAAHLVLVAVLSLGTVALAVRSFLPADPDESAVARRQGSGVGRAWREPRTLLVGVLTLAFAFTEGSANDWLAVALVDGQGVSEATAAVGFACFVAAMTAVRLFGGALLQRWGRVATLRAGGVTAVLGLLLFVTAPALPLAVAGAVLWGAGAALGFPVGMSAAADDPVRAAARVSVVSSIAYTAFLAGPPLIGLVAEVVGVVDALLVVLVVLAAGLLAAGATRPPATGQSVAARSSAT
ncbi:fucose permease [Geodermatophilus bullaregiensis]|uniref:MFS transporter n=1 Tax=Geodermatophilus bullaregiensis TaxID=1564160 RepID=UPI00195E2055|nr:MFS transporter [Geodermatophilus bullaregiensis]MBM7805355.1 fucose permease [Geodermatophilus bullaregiensis]